MRDYGSVSFWLETCGDDLTPRPSLEGSIDADVAIMGAGYTGLWTAYYLLKADPSLRVVILERDIAGFGASGRNGAWCAPGLNISLHRLAKLHGREAAQAVYGAVFDAVDEVGRVAAAEEMDIDWRRTGELIVSRGTHETPSLESDMRELESFGFGNRYQMLDATALADRVKVTGGAAALFTADAAAIHPAKLARGLARTVERLGGTIYEQSEVIEFRGRDKRSPDSRPTLTTAQGAVTADMVVLAGEAYVTRLRPLHRSLIPVWSLIVLTEPLPASVWEEIGWRSHELIGSPRYTVIYLSRTADGRILFGGRGAPYRFGSPIRDEYDRHDPTHDMLRSLARSWFPQLRDAKFTHAWGGPLGMPRDWHPRISFDRQRGIAQSGGYIGHGVSTANLGGRTLAELITDQQTARTRLPLVGHKARSWEPEPFRWLGVRFVQAALGRVDRKAEKSGEAPKGRSLEEWLARH